MSSLFRFFLVPLVIGAYLLASRRTGRYREIKVGAQSARRFLSSQVALIVWGLLIYILLMILTGNIVSNLRVILSSYLAALLVAAGVELLWQFISPYQVFDLPELVKGFQTTIQEDKQNEKALVIWFILVGVIFWGGVGILYFIRYDPSYMTLITIIFAVCLIFPDYAFITYFLAEGALSEEKRITLFVKALRDTLPAFVLAASLVLILRLNQVTSTPIFEKSGSWMILLAILIIYAIIIPLQYQKGVTRALKLKQRVINLCIKDLDSIEMLSAIPDEETRTGKLERFFQHTIDQLQISEELDEIFSTKNIYGDNPDNIRKELVYHLNQYYARMELSELLDHIHAIRGNLSDEEDKVKESTPIISEWLIAGLSILISTLLTKSSESIFELLKSIITL